MKFEANFRVKLPATISLLHQVTIFFFYTFSHIFTRIFNEMANYNEKQYRFLKIKSPRKLKMEGRIILSS